MGWIVDGETETDRVSFATPLTGLSLGQRHLTLKSWYNCETKIFKFKSEKDEVAVLVDARGGEGIKPEAQTK